jgi:FkbM family methyltransferase
MKQSLKLPLLNILQSTIIFASRPYIRRELPGWGRIFQLVSSHQRAWLWSGAAPKTVRGKLHNYVMHLDITQWADRSTYFLERWYDLGTQSFISDALSPGDTVVDVGANRGMFALIASRLVGDTGKVICFEPNPNCIAILEREIQTNTISNILIHKFALGEREQVLTLSVPNFNSGEGTFGESPYSEDVTYRVQTPIKVGDLVLENKQPSLIKIDVEGFECDVIAGLTRTIDRHHPIVLTEVAQKHLLACGSSIQNLQDLMEQRGYEGFTLGLKKINGQYQWDLTRFDPRLEYSDAAWIHRSSLEQGKLPPRLMSRLKQ